MIGPEPGQRVGELTISLSEKEECGDRNPAPGFVSKPRPGV